MSLDVSVVIPTYNRADMLPDAINSVADQTVQPKELIIVDDGSSDETEQVVGGIGYDRISYHKHDKNRGFGAARNTGNEIATGDYIAFLDSDDEWKPKKIEKQVSKLEDSSDEHRVCYCKRITKNVAQNKVYMTPSKGLNANNIYEGDVTKEIMMGWAPTPSSIMFERKLLKDVNELKMKYKDYIDHDFMLRLSMVSKFNAVKEPLLIRKIHGGYQLGVDPEWKYEGLKEFLNTWGNQMNRTIGEEKTRKFVKRGLSRVYREKTIRARTNRNTVEALRFLAKYIGVSSTEDIVSICGLTGLLIVGEKKYEKIKNVWRNMYYQE